MQKACGDRRGEEEERRTAKEEIEIDICTQQASLTPTRSEGDKSRASDSWLLDGVVDHLQQILGDHRLKLPGRRL